MATPIRSRPSWPSPTSALVPGVAAASGVLAALSTASPVGLRAADALWCAALGVGVPLLSSRARRVPLVLAGGVAAVVGISGGGLALACSLGLVVLLGLVAFSDRRDPVVAALIGALAVQALLRGPTYGVIGLPTIVGAVALVPVCISGWEMCRRRTRRVIAAALGLVVVVGLVGAGLAAMVAFGVRNDLEAAGQQAVDGLDLVRTGDTRSASDTFIGSQVAFGDASSRLEGPLTWIGRVMPVVGQHVEALRQVAGAGEDLADSAATTTSTADYRALKVADGTVDLAKVRALQQPVASSAATISRALAAVDGVRSPWLLGVVTDQLDRFDQKLDDVGDEADLAAQALAVAPALLGGDGTRHYLVGFATPAESRDGGGYIGAYGLLVAEGGKVRLDRSGPIGQLNPSGGLQSAYRFDPPPDWEERYGSYFVQLFMGNAGASPDWPTDAGVLGQLYPQAPGGVPLDGAIYADPAALAGLLRLSGPVRVQGISEQLDTNNAEAFLLRDQYVKYGATAGANDARRELLGDVARATFDALTSRPLPDLSTITGTLGPLVAGGHLRVVTTDPTALEYLERTGLSGQWSVPEGADVVSVRQANLLQNKIDSLLHRDIDVSNVVDPATGEVRSTVTITLRNDAPASGLPPYVIGNTVGLPSGTNRSLVTLHTPHELESATLDGGPVGVQRQREFDMPVYSAVVDLGPGESRQLVFELKGTSPGWPYRLVLIPQATANPDQLTVRIGRPGQEIVVPRVTGPLVATEELTSVIGAPG